MRIVILSCVLVILSVPVFAGTWVDDFAGGDLEDWEEIGIDAKWGESNGVVVSELAEKETGNRDFLITGDQAWEDYTITVKSRTVNLVGGDWCGMVFRYNDENSFYWFGVSLAWTSYAAGTASQTEWQTILRTGFGQWYELRAEVNGNNAKLFVDGELVLEIAEGKIEVGEGEPPEQASLPSSGRVGLFTQNAMGEFDNFSVTGPGIPDGGPGFPVEPKGRLTTEWGKIKKQGLATD